MLAGKMATRLRRTVHCNRLVGDGLIYNPKKGLNVTKYVYRNFQSRLHARRPGRAVDKRRRHPAQNLRARGRTMRSVAVAQSSPRCQAAQKKNLVHVNSDCRR